VMRHIFTNLLSNAVKYSRPKSDVHFSVCRDHSEAIFEIRDQGIGIPLEDQKALFEAFHRASNVGDIPGTGLGMWIVNGAGDLHRGKIEFPCALNRGPTFRVRLKLFAPRAAPRKKIKPRAKPAARSKSKR